MIKKYFNIIENKETDYEYRFKTEEEFQNQFGSNWRGVRCGFIDDMDYLFGMDYKSKVEYYISEEESDGQLLHNVDGWSISIDMLIKNKEKFTIKDYFKTKNIYEKKDEDSPVYYNVIKKKETPYPYRFKTTGEMKNGYLNYMNEHYPGENYTIDMINDSDWRGYIEAFFSDNMDFLSGEDYQDEYLTIDTDYVYRLTGNYKNYIISTDMLIKNSISPLYNMVLKKNKNIYENNIIKLNEYKNEMNDSYGICIYIKSVEELNELNTIIFEIDKVDQKLNFYYNREIPLYIIYSIQDGNISWVSNDEGLQTIGIEHVSYMDGVYKNIFNFDDDKDEITNIIKNKKIDYIPYFLKNPKNVYENINNKPKFFSQTYYRLPNEEELKNIDESNLNAKEILNGFRYTIVGRGILDSTKRDMIIQSIEKLIQLNQNNIEYRHALKGAQKIILK